MSGPSFQDSSQPIKGMNHKTLAMLSRRSDQVTVASICSFMTRAANHSSDPQLGNIDQTDWDAKAAELKRLLPNFKTKRNRLY
eukprot:g63178.t1